MAIFYDKIKGLPVGGTETDYKEIIFDKEKGICANKINLISKSKNDTIIMDPDSFIKMRKPFIVTWEDDGITEYFKVDPTTNEKGVYVNIPLYTKNNIEIKNDSRTTKTKFTSTDGSEKWEFSCEVNIKDKMLNICNNDGKTSYFVVKPTVDKTPGSITGNLETTLNYDLTVGGETWLKDLLTVDKLITCQGIDSLYFNATSDSRAKDNIKQLTSYTNNQQALKELCNWKIYSFNYKNDPAEKQIGIIAQEHLETANQLGFDVVNNKAATGENGDFMSVKEGKLVYVTIEAIQALNDEIKSLKEEIKQLKKDLNNK